MKRIKQWLCGFFTSHLGRGGMQFIDDSKSGADDAYYRCDRCGQTWDYYF